MGLGEQVGSIEAGKLADLVCVDLSPLETQPLHHVVSQLVYATGRHQVADVWVAGKARVAGGRLLDIDTDAIRAKARRWRERIAGLKGGA